MFNIYELQGELWIKVGSFSQLVDAEAQVQRFIDQGIPPENLEIRQEE